jgi:tRNA pseudouridine-54 N-methylase
VLFARRWREQGPRFLECLRELTLAFPAEGRIWTTSLAIREDMRGLVSGKSVDDKAVLELLDQLKKDAAFTDVKLVYIREAGGNVREVAYAISFVFVLSRPASPPETAARSKT